MRKGLLHIYRKMQRELSFLEEIAVFRVTEINRCFGALYSLSRRTQHKESCFWYHSMNRGCILIHAKFESELYNSVMRKRASLHKKSEVENKSSKKFRGAGVRRSMKFILLKVHSIFPFSSSSSSSHSSIPSSSHSAFLLCFPPLTFIIIINHHRHVGKHVLY